MKIQTGIYLYSTVSIQEAFIEKNSIKLFIKLFEENLDGPLYYQIISQILLPFMVEKYDLDFYLNHIKIFGLIR